MKNKLYAVLVFSKEGCFRGFASGFKKTTIEKIIKEELNMTNKVALIEDSEFSTLPSKFTEGHYWKFSQNTDDIKVLEHLIIIDMFDLNLINIFEDLDLIDN